MRSSLVGLAIFLVVLAFPEPFDPRTMPIQRRAHTEGPAWYKGNTHAHSIMMLRGIIPHGDSGPLAVASWYRDHGYDFAVVSDHNHYRDPTLRPLKSVQDDGFLLIPGVELTSDFRLWGAPQDGERTVHSTALNVDYAPDWSFAGMSKGEILNAHRARTARAGGITIVNHPNYRNYLELDDLLAMDELRLLEVHNAHPGARNGPANQRLSTEALWDALLTAGKRVYGIAADDAHYFRFPRLLTHDRRNFAMPGSAWVMVYARSLSADAIVDAIAEGQFYSTTGVMLEEVRTDHDRYRIRIDMSATIDNFSSPYVVEAAPRTASSSDGIEIEFIGPGGEVLKTVSGPEGELSLAPAYRYVRAKVTWKQTLDSRVDDSQARREFFAWTQPVFLDAALPAHGELLTESR